MNILYKDVPDHIYELIADKQAELKKIKHRSVTQPEAITALIEEAHPEIKKDQKKKKD